MKLFILILLLAPIFFLAFKQKKWYLYLFTALFAILPEQFAISLHDKLPLLSGSRILIILVGVIWFIQRLKARNFKPPISILVFLGINLILSAIHLSSDTDEIKRMFVLIVERGFVVVMLVDMIATREEFDHCIDFAIMGACVMAVFGICQTIFNYDIASVLHLTETLASVSIADRMGLTRAYATMNAISYGCYCAFMVLLIYYRLQNTKNIAYNIAFALNFVALIATFTRSAWLCIAGVMLIVFLCRPVKTLRRLWPAMIMIVALCLSLSLIQPTFGNALVETGKSSINTIIDALPDELFKSDKAPQQQTIPPTTGETATQPSETEEPTTQPPEAEEPTTQPSETEEPTTQPSAKPGFTLSENFGANAKDPTYSRMAQWSAVKYMAQEGTLLLGYGYNALPQKQIHFLFDRWSTSWKATSFLDVGLVALIAETGLIGFIAHMGLLGYMFIQAIRKKDRTKKFDFYKLTIFAIPLYLLLNFLAAFLNAELIWLFFGLFHAYERLDQKGVLHYTEAASEGQENV